MGRKGRVFINGRSVVTAKSGGTATAMPDVCKTPVPGGPPTPIPYLNTAKSADLTGACASVRIEGAPVFTQGAKLGQSMGNQAGSLGGVASGTVGGAAVPASFATNVRVGGQGVVRDNDSMWQNDRNAMGIIAQQAGPAASSAPGSAEASSACEICESCEHPTPESLKAGQHKRGDIAAKLKKAHGLNGTWEGHPWYMDSAKDPVQGHHLVDCAAMTSDGQWAIFCQSFGYNINCLENGVSLTSVAEVACVLRVPQHRGPHDDGIAYDKRGRPILMDAETAARAAQRANKRRHTDKRSGKPTAKKKKPANPYLCYPDAVINYLKSAHKLASEGTFCKNHDGFLDEMDEASEFIFKKLASFRWTLRPDGHNLRGGILAESEGFGCPEHDPNGKFKGQPMVSRNASHKKVRAILAARNNPHKLQRGK